MYLIALVTGLLAGPALASPIPAPIRRDDDLPVLHVTHFGAFLSNITPVPSHVSFHLVDPRPDNFAETNCILYSVESLFETGWVDCQSTSDVSFMLDADALRLRRVFLLDPADK
jgi:hypothetical protein